MNFVNDRVALQYPEFLELNGLESGQVSAEHWLWPVSSSTLVVSKSALPLFSPSLAYGFTCDRKLVLTRGIQDIWKFKSVSDLEQCPQIQMYRTSMSISSETTVRHTHLVPISPRIFHPVEAPKSINIAVISQFTMQPSLQRTILYQFIDNKTCLSVSAISQERLCLDAAKLSPQSAILSSWTPEMKKSDGINIKKNQKEMAGKRTG